MADWRRTAVSFAVAFGIFAIAKGDSCSDSDLTDAVKKFMKCLKESQHIALDKKIDSQEIGQECSKDWTLTESCLKRKIKEPYKKCWSKYQKKAYEVLEDMYGGRLQFLCDSGGHFLKEFWQNDGISCYTSTKQILVKSECSQEYPDFLDDYQETKTCQKQMNYLNCIKNSFVITCKETAKKIIYTHFKLGLMRTPCRDFLAGNDKNGLEVKFVSPNERETNRPSSADTNSFELWLLTVCGLFLGFL